MVPVLPMINQPPPRGLFAVLEFLPILFSLFVCISVLVTTVVIRCAYYLYRRQECIVEENRKIYNFVLTCYNKLAKFNVLIFPGLFTEKKLQLNNRERKKFLFLDKRLKYEGTKNPKTGLMVLFASLGIMIICISALGFFRNFPVITGSECLERNNNFNTWYCYNNTSSEPLDCKEYVSISESSNSNTLQCYAFSLDIGRSSAVAFGLYELCSLVVVGIVFLTKCFLNSRMSQKCEKPGACCVRCYGVTLFLILLIIALCLFVYEFFIDIDFRITGEHIYRCALPFILTVFAGYALIIPLLMHRYGVDKWPTYNCLATEDEEAKDKPTPCSVANDRTNHRQNSADPQEEDFDDNGDQQGVDSDKLIVLPLTVHES